MPNQGRLRALNRSLRRSRSEPDKKRSPPEPSLTSESGPASLAARTPPGNTPEVQRQYLGCVGKIANGIVTVLLEGTRGTFQTLLYLPNSWYEDRDQWRAGPEVHQVMSPEP